MKTQIAKRLLACCLNGLMVYFAGYLYPQNSVALNVIITNDDGFEASNIHALYHALLAAGHSAIIVSETQDNSGRGGAADFFHPIGQLTQDTRAGIVHAGAPGVGTLPGDANVHYVDGTPVAAVLYAVDVVAPRLWGRPADLVISGPNYGNNTGLVNNSSGTVNAALIAVNRGVPAIAVSAATPSGYKSFLLLTDQDPEYEDAAIVLRIINTLERARKRPSDTMLPSGVALNVNVPQFSTGGAKFLKLKLANEGLATSAMLIFSPDLSRDATAVAMGLSLPALPGVSAALPQSQQKRDDLPKDQNPNSEQNVIAAGFVSISVLKGNHQANKSDVVLVTRLLRELQ